MLLTYVLSEQSIFNGHESTQIREYIYKTRRRGFEKGYHLFFDKNKRFSINTFNLISYQIKKDSMCHNNFDLHLAILVFTSI